MVETITDRQYDGILRMIGMILEGCKDLDEAEKEIEEFRSGKKEKSEQQFQKRVDTAFFNAKPEDR